MIRWDGRLPLLTLITCGMLVSCSGPASEEPVTEAEETNPPPLACAHVMSLADYERTISTRPTDEAANRVKISGGTITWNGQGLNLNTLQQYLDITMTMTPTPAVIVDIMPDAVPQTVELVRAAIDRSQRCDSGAAFARPPAR